MLTAEQNDALTEVINIGFGRAAASLSELTRQRVLLEVPQVALYTLDEMEAELAGLLPGNVAAVHQVVTGPVAGDAMLLLSADSAELLVAQLGGQPGDFHEETSRGLDDSAVDLLAEVGNIILNACLSILGELLRVRLIFLVPEVRLRELTVLLTNLGPEDGGTRQGLLVTTGFRLRDSAIGGYLVIVLGQAAFRQLFAALEPSRS